MPNTRSYDKATGGMTLINTGGTALSGATTTISSIPGTYKELKIYITDWYASSQGTPEFYFNTDTTVSNYAYIGTRLFGSSSSIAVIGAQDTSIVYIGVPAAQNDNHLVISIPNYADSTVKKVYTAHSGVVDAGTNSVTMTAHKWNNTAAITAINFKTGGGTWSAGTIYVYGVK